MLKQKFKTLCQTFSEDELTINALWEEIVGAYSEQNRYYHTLRHLEQIYKALEQVTLTPLLEFSLFYHDIVYDVQREDNEEQSALLAQQRLQQLNLPQTLTDNIAQLIIETKTHKPSNEENKLFLDADLTVLGSSEKEYKTYLQNVRREYAIYDDVRYAKGRKKVLKHFLAKEKIYESSHFYERYEVKARENLAWELSELLKRLVEF